MIIENSDALKVWLTSCLGRMCDADPAALAKYVLALVKKEKTESELREFCLDQLEVFLLKDTKQFVDLLFETLKNKSYLVKPEINVTNTDATVNNSKKLSLGDSKDKGDSEKEKDSPKSDNVPKSKPVHFPSNSRTHSHSKGVSGRSRERRERNHRSRSHSSSSHSSRSSSRERLKEKSDLSFKHKLEERPREMMLDNNSFSHAPYHLNNMKGSNRCKDYDEKGYCMQGDLCIYDHGTDPVVLENVSVLNFGGVSLGTHVPSHDNNVVPPSLDVSKSPLPPPPPTSPPPLPPPPPPPPPLPATISAGYIPEPYNPEAPAMNITTHGDVANYWVPSNIHIPSIHHPRSQQLSGMSNSQHILPQHNSKPRTRELIGVPTVEVTDSNKNISLKTISTVPIAKKRKGFDYSRLGPKPKRINSEFSRTLELKRVPKHLNTIALLNSHFSKFGNITNIEVFYNFDPEAALIQFQTHAEAALAHNSTEAVLNNRFIQVFWHNKEEKNDLNKIEKFNTQIHKYKPHLKEVVSNNSEKLPEEKLPASSRVFTTEKNAQEKVPERSVVYSRGNICRTVFNPSVLKKVDNSSHVSSSGPHKEDKKGNKKLELYKKKQEYLESQMKHQKIILEKLSTVKNEKERVMLKEMLENLLSNIKEGQQDLKDFLKQHNSQKAPLPNSKSETEKLLLDAELDLYNTLNKCDNDTQQYTAELLLSKVNELKQKAKAFGLLDASGHMPSRETGIKAKRRQMQYPKSTSLSLKIDNRPKTLLISGTQDKDALKKHFQQFGDIEKIEENKLGVSVTFKTRKAAELALNKSKLDENLSVSWYSENQNSTSEDAKNANVPKVENDDIHFVDGDEDEDEEEDSEARSWRR